MTALRLVAATLLSLWVSTDAIGGDAVGFRGSQWPAKSDGFDSLEGQVSFSPGPMEPDAYRLMLSPADAFTTPRSTGGYIFSGQLGGLRLGDAPHEVLPALTDEAFWVSTYCQLLESIDASNRSDMQKATDKSTLSATYEAYQAADKAARPDALSRLKKTMRTVASRYPRTTAGVISGGTPTTLPSSGRHPFIKDPIPGWTPPPGAIPHDFNGVRYWVIPLAATR